MILNYHFLNNFQLSYQAISKVAFLQLNFFIDISNHHIEDQFTYNFSL